MMKLFAPRMASLTSALPLRRCCPYGFRPAGWGFGQEVNYIHLVKLRGFIAFPSPPQALGMLKHSLRNAETGLTLYPVAQFRCVLPDQPQDQEFLGRAKRKPFFSTCLQRLNFAQRLAR